MANETILIVDADTKSQRVLEVSLKKAGYRVVIEDSPARAMAAIGKSVPDLIISDTDFAEGDGFEFLADLKLDSRTASIPFIFLTEDRALPQKMRGFELGADDYLTKPVYIKEVTTRVELLLQKRAKDQLDETEIEEFEGQLEDITMIDLLQQIEGELRSGSLRLVRGRREAVVYFREGNILDAICGKLQGEEAIYRLMLWPEGSFVLRYHDNVRRADNIAKNSSELLLEGIRRLEKWSDLTAALPRLTRVFEADYHRLPGLIEDLPAEVSRIVRLFDGVRTIRDVVDDSPVDDVTTLQIVDKLLADDILRDVTPQGEKGEVNQRSNLAAWLADKSPAELTGELPIIERDGQGTLSKSGIVSAEASETEGGDKTTWKIHFDENVDPDEAIKQIEAEERRRREEEARQLAGMDTLQRAPAISRDEERSQLSADLEELMQAEAERRAVEAEQLSSPDDLARSTDMGFGHTEEAGADGEPREARVTERLRDAVSRTEPKGKQVTQEDIDSALKTDDELRETTGPIDDTEEENYGRGRKRQPTPISTPAGSIHGPSADSEFEIDEASTKELPPAGEEVEPLQEPSDDTAVDTAEETRPNAAEMSVTESEEVAREAAKTRDSGQFAPVDSGKESESSDGPGAEEEQEPQKAGLAEESDTSEFLDSADGESERGYQKSDDFDPFPGETGLDEVSEADAFSDSGEFPAVDEDDEIDSSERITRDMKPAHNLTPLGVEASEPEIGDDLTPDHDHEFVTPDDPSEEGLETTTDEFELEEIPAEAIAGLPKIERISKDGELVTASYELTRGSRRASKLSEKETLELPSAALESDSDPTDVVDDSTEADFFVDSDKSHDFEVHGEPSPEDGYPKAVFIVLAICLLGVMYVVWANQDKPPSEEDPVVATRDAAEPEAKDTVVAEKTDPTDRIPSIDPEFEAQASADIVTDQASNLAMIHGGTDLLATDDAGMPDAALAATEADMGQVEPPVTPDPDTVVAVNTPVTNDTPVTNGTPVTNDTPDKLDAKPVEKPDEQPPAKIASGPSLAQAEKLLRQEKFNAALSMLRDLSKQKPSDGKIAYLHGQAAFSDMKNAEAITNLKRAERLGYRPANLYLDLAAAYTLDGKKPQARAAYEKFLKLKPNGREADQVRKILESRF